MTSKISNKDLCGLCSKEFTTKTLEKYNGMCFNCSKKSVTSNTLPKNTETKVSCTKCQKLYTQKTLKKHDGICGKCFNLENPNSDTSEKKKDRCTKCSKEFTLKTLTKYSGLCNRCYTKENTQPMISSAFYGIPKVSSEFHRAHNVLDGIPRVSH